MSGGLGGASCAVDDLDWDNRSLEALRSVAGGVSIFPRGPRPTASLLCCFENEGYGRLDLDSDLSGDLSSSSEITPGMDERRCDPSEVKEALEVDLSFDEVLREACVRWRCLRSLSSFEDSLRSRRRSGLFSRNLEGMTNDVHYATL